jgi:hypothetical protein
LAEVHTQNINADAPPESMNEQRPSATSRREMLRMGGKKALYLTPVVMTLAASHAHAGSNDPFLSWCGNAGSPCVVQEDCCPGLQCIMNDLGGKDCME